MKTALLYPYPKKDATACDPPISLLYLAAALQRAGEDVIVVDADNGDLSGRDIAERLSGCSPQLIGMPLFSNSLSHAYRLVDLLDPDRFGWKIVLGGPHASARPQEVLEVFTKCDYVLRGESEKSLVELVQCLDGQRGPESVKGLSYRLGDRILHNPDAPLNRDLDGIPFPARHLLSDAYKKGVYWRLGHRGTTDMLITSRGCPYRCNFCYQISSKFRTRSPENILEELALVRSEGTRSIQILDDLFVFDKQRCLRILSMIEDQKLDMEFKVRARVDRIDEELLNAMREAGVKTVVYGIESGSQKMLDLMNKRTTVEMNRRAIAMTKKAGLRCYVDAFIGFPGETPETIRQTEALLVEAKPTAMNLSVMYPLPGTQVYKQAREQGTLIGDWDIKGTRPWIKLPWIDNLGTLWEIRNRLHRKFLLDPVVIFNLLRFFVPRVSLRQIRYLIRQYARVTLKA